MHFTVFRTNTANLPAKVLLVGSSSSCKICSSCLSCLSFSNHLLRLLFLVLDDVGVLQIFELKTANVLGRQSNKFCQSTHAVPQRCIEWQVIEIVFLFRNNPLMKVPLPGIRKTCGCMKYIRKILQLQHVSCLDLVEAHRLDTSVTEKQSWRILKWTLTLLHSGRKLFP